MGGATVIVRLHEHAFDRLPMRGATEQEVVETVMDGSREPANLGRTLFRKEFPFDAEWRGRRYATKTVEAIAVDEDGWLVITVIVKFRRAPQ